MIGALKMKIEEKVTLTIIQIYAPTARTDKEEIKKFCKELEGTWMKEKEYYTIIMGDSNSKIGKEVERKWSMWKIGIRP